MRIGYKGDYAIKSLIFLAVKYLLAPNSYWQIAEIAKEQDIPAKYLEQILLMLRKAGYVKSQRGMKGGFALALEPQKINLGQIIRLVEGPLAPIDCVAEGNDYICDFQDRCVLRPLWQKVSESISQIIDTIDFQSLAEKQLALERSQQQSMMYYI